MVDECVYPKLRELSLQIWPLKFEEETWKTKTMDEVILDNCSVFISCIANRQE